MMSKSHDDGTVGASVDEFDMEEAASDTLEKKKVLQLENDEDITAVQATQTGGTEKSSAAASGDAAAAAANRVVGATWVRQVLNNPPKSEKAAASAPLNKTTTSGGGQTSSITSPTNEGQDDVARRKQQLLSYVDEDNQDDSGVGTAGPDDVARRKQQLLSYVSGLEEVDDSVDSSAEPARNRLSTQSTQSEPGAYAAAPGTDFQRRVKVTAASLTVQPAADTSTAIQNTIPPQQQQQQEAAISPSPSKFDLNDSIDIERGGQQLSQPGASFVSRNTENEAKDCKEKGQQLTADCTPIDQDKKKNNRIKMIALIAIAICVIIIVAAVVVGVVVGMGSGSESSNGTKPGGGGTETTAKEDNEQSPTDRLEQLEQVFGQELSTVLPAETVAAIQFGRNNNPQLQAFEWLLEDPNLPTYSIPQKRQRLALSTIYYATNGPHWFDDDSEQAAPISNPWLTYHLHECEWFSLAQEPCYNYTTLLKENHQHVDYNSLVLSGNPAYNSNKNNNTNPPALQGTLPPQLGLLTKLHTLDVGYQNLKGSIPTELVQLSSTLQEIVLESAFFTGTIPETLFEFPRVLLLGRNHRLQEGTIPSNVWSDKIQLQHLSLVETNRLGTLPTQLFQATNLEKLLLGDNQITGTLATEIGQLRSIQHINIKLNQFTGSIPSEVGLLDQLAHLFVGANRFSGELPTQIGLLENLEEFELIKNELSGSVPSEIGSSTKLSYLNLAENEFTGIIPTSLSQLSALRILKMNNNQFEGQLRPELLGKTGAATNNTTTVTWPRLEQLVLASNQMTGALPSEIGLLKSLQNLNLRSNDFDSTLPSELGLLESLQFMPLEATKVSGIVPEEMCSLPFLELCIECSQLECPADCGCTCA